LRFKLFLFIVFSGLLFTAQAQSNKVVVGAERIDTLLKLVGKQRVAIVANQTSLVGDKHLVDTLKKLKVNIVRVFGPEHGFRGNIEAGEKVENYTDVQSGLPVISLYGNKKKPTPAELADVDMLIFDIQDVGARFYTYISTMHYVMEACADNNKSILILDRPNPNGHYVDGPVMQPCCTSFVGKHPVPIVHGMTIGEYAQMINGEGWLGKDKKAKLQVIPCLNYDHNVLYKLPVPPSPNLPTMKAVYLYPSLCLLEGTPMSIGRGTTRPFELIGHPNLSNGDTAFRPVSIPGFSKNPPQENKVCRGVNIGKFIDVNNPPDDLEIQWVLLAFRGYPDKDKFFNSFFTKLAGNKVLEDQIYEGVGEEVIRRSWQNDLEKFKAIRAKYLLYEDFGIDDD
jgi:uncharacterized protein YbbC (DUF1343 family)